MTFPAENISSLSFACRERKTKPETKDTKMAKANSNTAKNNVPAGTESAALNSEIQKGTVEKPIILRKITPRDIIGAPDKKIMREKTFTFKISGRVSRTETVQGKFGKDSIKFKGAFLVESPVLGFVSAGQAFLPPVAENLVFDALQNAIAEGGTNVEFGLECYTRLDEKSSVGYTWEVKPLVKVKSDSNRLLQLMQGDESSE